jgi:hypothetical protein
MTKKSSAWDKAKSSAAYWGVGGGGTILGILKGLYDYGTVGGKDGGRVTPRGIGKAKRGFGRAMRKK